MKLLLTGNALATLLCLLVVQPVSAQQCCGPAEEACCGTPSCCGHCGGHGSCAKMCKVVCEMKEVKKTVWTVKCEEFCAPLPGCPGCHGRGACGGCAQCGGCSDSGCDSGGGNGCGRPNMVPPKCGPVRTRKVLVPKEVVTKVPVYKCVPCYACGACCESGAVQPMPADGKVPAPAPAPAAPKAPKAPVKEASSSAAPLPPLVSATY